MIIKRMYCHNRREDHHHHNRPLHQLIIVTILQSCKDIAETLFDCMKKSDCVKNGSDIRTCMKEEQHVCSEYRNAYFTCKRAGLDMRTRIKGQQVY